MSEKDESAPDPSDAVNEFMQLFGGKKEAEAFMADAQLAAEQEAWDALHTMYQGFVRAGFSRSEAMELIVTYMLKSIGMD